MDHDIEVDAVRAVEDAYDRAWNRGDLTRLIDCLCEDVVLVNPRGQVAFGREEESCLDGPQSLDPLTRLR